VVGQAKVVETVTVIECSGDRDKVAELAQEASRACLDAVETQGESVAAAVCASATTGLKSQLDQLATPKSPSP